jgi:hypothetical protein
VPVGRRHDSCNQLDVVVGHIFVEQITHRIHEHHSLLRPGDGFRQFFRYEPQVESLFVGMTVRKNIHILSIFPTRFFAIFAMEYGRDSAGPVGSGERESDLPKNFWNLRPFRSCFAIQEIEGHVNSVIPDPPAARPDLR